MTTKYNFALSPVVMIALLLGAVFTTISPVLPASAQGQVFEFSISAQNADPNYQENIRVIFARVTGADPAEDFSGGIEIPAGQTISINDVFGPDSYMDLKFAGGIVGGGACNVASFIYYAAAASGLTVRADDLTHDPVPGVPGGYWVTVYATAPRRGAAEKDAWITNPGSEAVWIYWEVKGDTVRVWVSAWMGQASPLTNQGQAARTNVLGLQTQDLSQVPLPAWIAVGLVMVFVLGLLNQKTRGVAALGILVVLVAGLAYMVINHRDEIRWPRDPNTEIAQPTPAPAPPDGACEISPKYPAEIQQWCVLITGYARLRGFDPNFIAAQILQESGGNPEAYSKSGAVGLMQVMPRDGIAATFKNDQGVPYFADRPTIEQLKDPTFNVDYGTGMMEGLRNKFSAGYTAEQLADPAIQRAILREALKKYGPRDRGYEYADIVLAIWDSYR